MQDLAQNRVWIEITVSSANLGRRAHEKAGREGRVGLDGYVEATEEGEENFFITTRCETVDALVDGW